LHKSNQPKVSIHIIAFNQKDYIAEAIESAVGQDYENLEVVVSDDASTDGTADIIAAYQLRYPNRLVALLNKNNVGITANSNRGLRACTGKYIAFQGGDDVLLPGKITAQVKWFEKDEKRVLCGHQVEVFYEDGSRSPHLLTKRMAEGAGSDQVIRHGWAYAATATMVRAEKIPPHGFDEALAAVSDYMMWIEVLAHGGIYGYVNGTYARYRRHSANVSNSHLIMLRDIERTLMLFSERYPQYRHSCNYALAVLLPYTSGVFLIQNGKKKEARNQLSRAICANPFFIKAWLRLAQTF
jgi:glycosyltransferase involved in cell wall biosynthesis